jgi:hypothetical protein
MIPISWVVRKGTKGTKANNPLPAPPSQPSSSVITNDSHVGRIRSCLSTWRSIASGSYFRFLASGVVPLFSTTPTYFHYFSPFLSAEFSSWWNIERSRLLASGAIRQISRHEARHVCASFVIPKKQRGSFRLIIDFRPLN